ncbi:MAG: GntG family PLP-dependent aldolase [Christensenellales bacterium]|nr:aminotransferase class I/II-fold pyridoxal phosphate-dependent enzyme [Clostridiales bacterium]
MKLIDLRSDTVTRPTPAMYEAMVKAPLGDDVYGDDLTVNELEALAAEVMGKEAALFVCSGTMGNQLAIMTHTSPGQEIITALDSHVIQHEAGAHARLSGVSAMIVDTQGGTLTPEDVYRAVRTPDLHHPVTRLVCLENALGNGEVVSLEQMTATAQAAHQAGLMVHLDGARIFNAAAALGVDVKALVKDADSVMFCLSKGLCAPVGSMLCGSREFIDRARKNRKILGGGLRQAGVLAACGLISIQQMTTRLHEDHENARALAEALSVNDKVSIDMDSLHINMVWAGIPSVVQDDAAFVAYMKEHGVLINGQMGGLYRFVTHHDVSRADVRKAADIILEYLS